MDFSNWEHLWSHTFLGGSWSFPAQKTVIKAKVSPNLSWALAINHNLGSYGSYSAGMQMKELGRLNEVKFGVTMWLDL